MAHTNTVLSQILKITPRHEFESLANARDGCRKSTALSRWSQFVALTVGQLGKLAKVGHDDAEAVIAQRSSRRRA